jgi:hypothetical protein
MPGFEMIHPSDDPEEIQARSGNPETPFPPVIDARLHGDSLPFSSGAVLIEHFRTQNVMAVAVYVGLYLNLITDDPFYRIFPVVNLGCDMFDYNSLLAIHIVEFE